MHEAHLPIAAFGGNVPDDGPVSPISSIMRRTLLDCMAGEPDGTFADHQRRRNCLRAGAHTRLFEAARAEEAVVFVHACVYGLLTFLAVEVIGGLLDASQQTMSAAAKGGFGAFLYLEVLDASFSFDGVIGAFALTRTFSSSPSGSASGRCMSAP